MLFLLFQFGAERYAMATSQVVAVLPRLAARAIPHAPPAVVGLCRYGGSAVPVIDLTQLALGRPSEDRLSTRIVLVRSSIVRGPGMLGLLAEKVTQTRYVEPTRFGAAGVAVEGAPYLGAITIDAEGIIQRTDVDRLLPESLRRLLFEAVDA
jgi:chemotaxis-related protein WspB